MSYKHRGKKLFAKFNKCEFWLNQVVFLGHIISSNGLKVDSQKVEAIESRECPKTVFEVRSFLGLFSYYRRFVQVFSKLALTLTTLTRKATGFE